jgi:hypothetical protein
VIARDLLAFGAGFGSYTGQIACNDWLSSPFTSS